MRQSSQNSGQLSPSRRTVVRREEKADRIIAFLRQVHPVKTAEHVAADIGASVDAVQKMMSRGSMPGALSFGRMILAYGPAFLIAVFPQAPAWLDEAHRRERHDALRAEQRRIQEQLDALGA